MMRQGFSGAGNGGGPQVPGAPRKALSDVPQGPSGHSGKTFEAALSLSAAAKHLGIRRQDLYGVLLAYGIAPRSGIVPVRRTRRGITTSRAAQVLAAPQIVEIERRLREARARTSARAVNRRD